MLDPMMEQLLPGFLDECKEIAERVTEHLIELEKAHDQARFDDLARGLHTLKGSAATLGLSELSELAHRMEDVVLPLRGKNVALPGAMTDALLKTLDVWMAHLRATTAKAELPELKPSHKLLEGVRQAVLAVDAGKPAANNGKAPAENEKQKDKEKERSKPASEKKSAKKEREARSAAQPEPAPAEPAAEEDALQGEEAGSWRVRTREVVSLLHEVERLREVRLRLEERRRELERALSQLARLGILAQTAEVRALLMGVQRALHADGEEAGDIVASMEDELKAICTLPVRTVLEPLRRAVRDLCKQSGKLAKLSIVGGEVSLDRRVLESLRGPLVHLVRNAVDHGLELPDLREARGKHREGALVVRVEQQGNMLFIELAGAGGAGRRAPARAADGGGGIVAGVEDQRLARRAHPRAAPAPRAAHSLARSRRAGRAAAAGSARRRTAAPDSAVAGQAARDQRRRSARRPRAGDSPLADRGARSAGVPGRGDPGPRRAGADPAPRLAGQPRPQERSRPHRHPARAGGRRFAHRPRAPPHGAGGRRLSGPHRLQRPPGAGTASPFGVRRDGLRHRHG